MLLAGITALSAGCNNTRHLAENQYLLHKNRVVLVSDKPIANKGERKENLYKIIAQKPNTDAIDILPFKTPLKLWRYNHKYKKLHNLPDSSLPKSYERPVILDTAMIPRVIQNMKSYLFNQGYFYARIRDSIVYSRKKAVVTYIIQMGDNYLINKVNYDIDDSDILGIVRANADASGLTKEREFTYSLLDDERSRITALIRNSGYYRFTQENVTFKIDTFDKAFFRDLESPFENAVNFIKSQKINTKPTIDIDVIIRLAEDTNAYRKYTINSVHVYPDYKGPADLKDSSMLTKTIGNVQFKYHDYYVRPRVLYQHIYLNPGHYYSQADFNKTNAKLNELGIFQYVRIDARENRANRGTLDYNILLNRTKKHDLLYNYEISSGSTYALGNSIGATFRDKNFMRGANLLTIGASGGLEAAYNESIGRQLYQHLNLLTIYYGLNASLDFPKFLAPVASSLFTNSNLPHTIVSGGENALERINYFTLVNTSANFAYSWRETQTTSWTFSPSFINIIRLPVKTDSFNRLLNSNSYLKNSYEETFIEGENISFTYDNIVKKHGVNYSYLRLGLEEAGALMGVVNKVGEALNGLYKFGNYARYAKFDFDGRHYFTFPHSVLAVRFYGGIGLPYDDTGALPYIKQYFAGGPYSLRGWTIRTLGPGSYFDPAAKDNPSQIDRTGDIKLESNAEYRFPITPLFAGNVKMNGAFFADAGNIWLAKKDKGGKYAGGEIELSTFGQTLAADMGLGFRFDIASFITLRLDVAIPVKKPYVHTSGGWVFNQVDFGNSTWRKDNIVPIITIGYPF
jgi:outer membrane protein insertion porin family